MSDFTCPNCKVNVDKNHNHCPLCGKHINSEAVEEQNRKFPIYKPKLDKREPITSIFIKLILLSIIVCIGVDLFITANITFSLYVLVGGIYTILVVLLPIFKKYSLAKVFTSLVIYTAGVMLFCELITHSWGWGVCYAIPGFWILMSIISGIFMLAFGYVNFEMFRPMLFISILSTISLIFLMCYSQVYWLMLVSTFVSWVEIALMFMFRFKRSIRTLGKDFRI